MPAYNVSSPWNFLLDMISRHGNPDHPGAPVFRQVQETIYAHDSEHATPAQRDCARKLHDLLRISNTPEDKLMTELERRLAQTVKDFVAEHSS